MKKDAWLLVSVLLLGTYFLSSIPGLRVLPLLREINALLQGLDISITRLAAGIAARLPQELGPARTLTEDFLVYARSNPVIIEFFLRKTAHVVLFFFITIAFYLLLRHYIQRPWLAVLTSFLVATAVAVLDEYHQSFVPERAGSAIDVAIDLVGITLAVGLIIFAHLLSAYHRR